MSTSGRSTCNGAVFEAGTFFTPESPSSVALGISFLRNSERVARAGLQLELPVVYPSLAVNLTLDQYNSDPTMTTTGLRV
jgi:hypothetical protein